MMQNLYTLVASRYYVFSQSLTARKEGQTLVEYGLILALVSLIVVAVLTLIGGQLRTFFSRVTSVLT